MSLYEDPIFQEKMQDETPYTGITCDECGAPIEIDEDYWIVNDWILCENCLDKCRRRN